MAGGLNEGIDMLTKPEPMVTEPTRYGGGGRAWRLDIDAICAGQGIARDHCAWVASWLVEACWAHPIWHSYNVQMIHLRPLAVADRVPLKRHLNGATHELVVFALDPGYGREMGLATGRFHRLLPYNFAAQIIADHDRVAANMTATAVDLILSGKLSPDSDFRHEWGEIFGFNMTD